MHGGDWKTVAVGSGLNGRLGALGFYLGMGHGGRKGERSVDLNERALAGGVEEARWNETKGGSGKWWMRKR